MASRWDFDYHVEEDSDFEEDGHEIGAGYPSSSDDELQRSVHKDFGSMENELNKIKEFSDSESKDSPMSSNMVAKKIHQPQNSDGYHSSGSEEGDGENLKGKPPTLSNDDLLYDPEMDDKDQLWINRQRSRHRKATTDGATSCRSDAILSCPACMTTVCIDCQRHEVYKNQYRAMFVMNVQVIADEILRYEVKRSKNKAKKRAKVVGGTLVRDDLTIATETDSLTDSEKYHPVKCRECSTEVAVYDQEEVYHFFNVLASQA